MNVFKKMTSIMTVCLSAQGFAQVESPAIQKMKFECHADVDASSLFTAGTARMNSSVEGIMEVESGKGVREKDVVKFPMTVKLKYRMQLEQATSNAGFEVSVSEGEIEKPSTLFQHLDLNTMKFSVTKKNEEAYVDMEYSQKMGGWTAHLTSFLDIPGSDDKMKVLDLRVSIPCSVHAAE